MKYFIPVFIILFLMAGCHLFHNRPSSETITVMTYNIRYGTAKDGENRWELREPILLDCIRQHKPDLLGVQESMSFQTQAIQKNFPEWRVFGKGRYYGLQMPDRPHESMDGESCKIFYNTNKFTLLREGTFWHSDTPDVPASITWGNTLPRIFTWGHFRSRTTGKEFVMFNTHLHSGEPYVVNTTQLFLQKWPEIAGALPSLLTGDFNQPPTGYTHGKFCSDSTLSSNQRRFADVWQLLGKSEVDAGTSSSSFKLVKNKERIDWILCTNEFRAQDIQIDYYNRQGRLPSDHYPVIAKLRF